MPTPFDRRRRAEGHRGRTGDRPDAGQVYRALAPSVLGYLRAERTADPEDLLGEVFLQVARDIGRFRGDEEALRRWVFSIAHNRLVDAHRRRSRRPLVHDSRPPEGRVEAPPDPFDPELAEAVAGLSPDQREVVVLRFVGDLSLESVARITGRKVGAVKALQHRALENLARAVSRGR